MGAQFNFILASDSADAGFWRRAIAGLEPTACRSFGPLKMVAFHNFRSDDYRRWAFTGRAHEEISNLSDDEIVTFYPDPPGMGCLQLTREGRFAVVSVSVRRVQNPSEFLRRIWQEVGSEFSVALMGEELEICETELDFLSRNARVPQETDLCEAAIVKMTPEATLAGDAMKVEHGAVLVRA